MGDPPPAASSQLVSSLVTNFKLSDFTEFELKGQGSEAHVYKAYNGDFGEIAIKHFVTPVAFENAREIGILLAYSRHPNIVSLFGLLLPDFDSRVYLGYVMEYMPLGSLHDIIHNSSILYDQKQVFSWIEQIARALYHLHKAGILHRDCKPKNILVGKTIDDVKIGDFGTSQTQILDTLTRGIGTVDYMAPEVILKGSYDQSADVFSLAVTSWEALHRRIPYSESPASDWYEKLGRVIRGTRPRIDPTVVDPTVTQFLKRSWESNPEGRMTMLEIIQFARQRKEVKQEMAAVRRPVEQRTENTGEVTIVPERKRNICGNNKETILIIGGRIGQKSVDEMLSLSPDGLNWTRIPKKLPQQTTCGGAVWLGGEIFVVGGRFYNDSCYDSLWKLDSAQKWVSLSRMTERRAGIGGSCVVFDGCIWVLGGFNGKARLNSVEKYEPERNEWKMMPRMNEVRSAAAAAVCQGKIIICGGMDGNNYLKTVECFDAESGVWTLLGEMPDPRKGHSLVSDGQNLTVIGGENRKKCFGSVIVAKFEEGPLRWTAKAPINNPRAYFTTAKLGEDGRIFIIGGWCKEKEIKGSVEIFDGRTWKEGPALPRGCDELCSVVLPRDGASSLFGMFANVMGAL